MPKLIYWFLKKCDYDTSHITLNQLSPADLLRRQIPGLELGNLGPMHSKLTRKFDAWTAIGAEGKREKHPWKTAP